MIAPPTLRTARLVLEPLTPAHSVGMFRLWSREEVCRHSGPAQDWNGDPIRLPAQTSGDSDKIIDFYAQMSAAGRGFRWAMIHQPTQDFAGAIGFNSLAPIAELAFHLRPEFWGQGLMREAAEAALAWAAVTTGSPVEAFIEPANAASVALARRLGFTPTGDITDGAERFRL